MALPTARDIDKLRLQSGDVLVLYMEPFGPDGVGGVNELAKAIRNHLWTQNIEDVLILAMRKGVSLEKVDEAMMASAGWVRSKTVAEDADG